MTTTVRRAFALTAGLWFVLGFALGARHEAIERHAMDARGFAVHASRMIGAHHADQADIHAVDGGTDSSEPCGIVTALHQPISAQVADASIVTSTSATPHHIACIADATAPSRAAVYRLAPKTSPPRG